MRYGLHERTHEAPEWPWALDDHVVTIEGDIEHRIENIGIGEIDKKVIGRCSHPTMRKNDPYDDAVATHRQENDDGEEE